MMHRVVRRALTSSSVYRGSRMSHSHTPFHLAVPVHDLNLAKEFYGGLLGFEEGVTGPTYQARTHRVYNMFGHQLVIHNAGPTYRCVDLPAAGDDVPMPHFGVCLSVGEFHSFRERMETSGVRFTLPPHVRYEGRPGEQWKLFFKDPSGNNLEIKALVDAQGLFAKYIET
ncbi:Aste57867_14931 [Aphanomyces stellatus]|uniref:Aste57867_14931 protein n=1 Tax=Aphanomyces stellatus TaxID=120398 RepID=A0A485L2Z6_9STRA|nr:hypothetical protein As57867_014875 [Aphanomyces stellatus]VFT91746.1 Aste57867_14931 [Aphanomyces stellatus]